jgi:hypothetical protein
VIFALRAQTIGVRMKSKTKLKSPDRFGDCHATSNDHIKVHALIRRRALRCVRPILREPDSVALRLLERIDLKELVEIVEEASNGLDHEANVGGSGCRTRAEERRDRIHQLTWLHYMGGLFGRTQPDLPPAVTTNLATLQRSLKADIRKLKNTRR